MFIEILKTSLLLFVFLISARVTGHFICMMKQPRVIGEILGGFILGPTVLGYYLPEFSELIFIRTALSSQLLQIVYQMGLVLLMFISGLETEQIFSKGQRRTTLGLVFLGTTLPLMAGYFFSRSLNLQDYMGPSGNEISISFVLGCAAAVTSLPVLSRIFIDLGILQTPFCRLILAAALIDDILLYIIMALVLAVSNLDSGSTYNLISVLFSDLPKMYQTILAAGFQLGFTYFMIRLSPQIVDQGLYLVHRFFKIQENTTVYLSILILTITIGWFLSIPFVLSAFCAGVSLSKRKKIRELESHPIQNISIKYFIPVYFAIVGSRMNLIENFSFIFTFGFLLYATVVKTVSIWFAAQLARYSVKTSFDIAMTMNARGGPGIILASVAYDAQIINLSLYTTLIFLAVVTCLISAFWLKWRIMKNSLDTQLLERSPRL